MYIQKFHKLLLCYMTKCTLNLEAILALWSPLGYQKSQRSNANHPHLNILPIFKSYPMKLPFEIFEFN